MTPAQFIAWGEALFGSDWKAPLARALGMNRRTIIRYAAGEREIPDDLLDELRVLARGQAMRAAIREEDRARAQVAKLKAMAGNEKGPRG
jgi:hypothetical protein